MPEGPTIVLLKEEVASFAGQKVEAVEGNTKLDKEILVNRTVSEFRSWGKHFLICFGNLTVRIHFMLFGSYAVNSRKLNRAPRLSLIFSNGEINFYACSVKFIEGDISTQYEWCADVMNDCWDPKAAKEKLKKKPEMLICDALLTQDIFAGVGNIIKNEVLYRLMIHPESLTGKIPASKIQAVIREARIYSFQFLDWKRNFELKKHYLAHTKSVCERCNLPLVRKNTGIFKRRSFFCPNCQKLFV